MIGAILGFKGVAVAAVVAGTVIIVSKINTVTPAPVAITQPIDTDTKEAK